MIDYLKEYFDYKAFLICLGLIVIGLVSVYSATHDVGAAAAFHKQVVWSCAGLVALVLAAAVPVKFLQRAAVYLYGLGLAALIGVLVAGHTVLGSERWFGVAGLGGQPSEFVKISTVLALAAFASKTSVCFSNTKHMLVAAAIVCLPMVLIVLQPDVGTAIVCFAMLLTVLYWGGAPNFVLAAVLVPVLAAVGALMGSIAFILALIAGGILLYATQENRFAAIVVFAFTIAIGLSVQAVYERMPVYQQKRISTFLNPGSDQKSAGYNVNQSKVAIGSGGFLGKGYLHGTQTQLHFIPEQRTDFIFCVPGEEFGFVGSAVILGLFMALLLHGVRVAGLAENKFMSAASIGITGIFGAHVLVNIGMSMGLMPVAGIPLPFISYGGSALIADMAMVGLLMNFYSHRKEH